MISTLCKSLYFDKVSHSQLGIVQIGFSPCMKMLVMNDCVFGFLKLGGNRMYGFEASWSLRYRIIIGAEWSEWLVHGKGFLLILDLKNCTLVINVYDCCHELILCLTGKWYPDAVVGYIDEICNCSYFVWGWWMLRFLSCEL